MPNIAAAAVTAAVFTAAAVIAVALLAPSPARSAGAASGPRYTADGRLIAPADYREWVFVGSGIDMSYNPHAVASSDPVFDNVFADPLSYRAFVATGTWPDRTQLVSEVRGSSGRSSINHRGRFQSGDALSVEVHVKDVRRFDGGWAFFAFDDDTPTAPLPATADCYACHRQNAAVDTTFVQFYPTLLSIARQKSTLSPAYVEAQRILGKAH